MAVVPPVSTCPAPGVARPLDGAVVAVVPDGAVVAGVVAGVVVAGVVAGVVGAGAAVVGAADVAGVCPLIGGWVRGTVVAGVVGPPEVDVDRPTVGTGAAVVGGAAVVVFVPSSPLRTTKAATPAPRTATISTASAIPTSRLRWVPPEFVAGPASAERLCRVGLARTWTPYHGPLTCGCSSVVELQPSKLITPVRFRSPAPRRRWASRGGGI